MGPLVERVDRLHVVVTIEEDARLAIGFSVAGFPDHDRVAFRRPHLGGEADAVQIGGDKFSRGATGILISGISRDRLDAQQREQATKACIQIGINPLQHRIKLTHEGLRKKAWPAHS